jgi:hypothetical protein
MFGKWRTKRDRQLLDLRSRVHMLESVVKMNPDDGPGAAKVLQELQGEVVHLNGIIRALQREEGKPDLLAGHVASLGVQILRAEDGAQGIITMCRELDATLKEVARVNVLAVRRPETPRPIRRVEMRRRY